MAADAFRLLGLVVLLGSVLGCAGHKRSVGGSSLPDPLHASGQPGPAWSLLEQAAASTRPALRAEALASLVRASKEPGARPFSERGTWDPDPWVAQHTLTALVSRLPEAEAQAQLVELALRDGVDPYLGCRAALAVGGEASAELKDAVRRGWEGRPAWRGAPCAAAGATMGDDEARAALLAAVSQANLALDPTFTRVLATLEVRGLDEALAQGHTVAEELLQPALATAMVARGLPDGDTAFRAALDSADPLVQMEAVLLLETLPLEASERLLTRASSGSGPHATLASLVLAARLGDAAHRGFSDAAVHPDRDLRAHAVVLYGEAVARSGAMGGARRRFEKVLGVALTDAEPGVQVAALDAAAVSASRSFLSVAEALLADEDADVTVRIAAARAALALGAP